MRTEDTYTVEVGKDRGAYKVRWRFSNRTQAEFYYRCLNTFGAHKKRLRRNGHTLARQIGG